VRCHEDKYPGSEKKCGPCKIELAKKSALAEFLPDPGDIGKRSRKRTAPKILITEDFTKKIKKPKLTFDWDKVASERASGSNTRRGNLISLRTPRRGYHMDELRSFEFWFAKCRFLGAVKNSETSLQ